jgi:metal-sulfur cluster biosynthetic enzyme
MTTTGGNAGSSAVYEALREVIDPELGVNVVDLGLVYAVAVDGERVHVEMTMTTPACPIGAMLREEVDAAIREHLPQVREVELELVWEPPWTPERMTDAARAALGWA